MEFDGLESRVSSVSTQFSGNFSCIELYQKQNDYKWFKKCKHCHCHERL